MSLLTSPLIVLVPLAVLGFAFVWAFVMVARDLVWEEQVRRRQWRLEDQQQRAYKAKR